MTLHRQLLGRFWHQPFWPLIGTLETVRLSNVPIDEPVVTIPPFKSGFLSSPLVANHLIFPQFLALNAFFALESSFAYHALYICRQKERCSVLHSQFDPPFTVSIKRASEMKEDFGLPSRKAHEDAANKTKNKIDK